jgi:hypothetical protein
VSANPAHTLANINRRTIFPSLIVGLSLERIVGGAHYLCLRLSPKNYANDFTSAVKQRNRCDAVD